MNLDQTSKRRIRIEGKPGETIGFKMRITDAQTGELIQGVKSVIIYLNPAEVNQAEITYYEHEEDGSFRVKDGEVVESKMVASHPAVDVTAYERLQDLESIIYQALGEASMCWSERPTGVFDDAHALRIGKKLLEAFVRYGRQEEKR